ncbi:MAG TPA: hypothetical protein VMH22_02360 [bacterium]|nr:hypothetical protein [bacterium]
MIDPSRRIENWDAGFDTTAIKAKTDKKRPKMLEHVSSVQPMLAAMELQVKQVCDGAGCSIIQYPFYLCFGREMWSLTRKDVSGESMAQEAATLIAKWVARGLASPVLQAIRSDVFNVGAPISP